MDTMPGSDRYAPPTAHVADVDIRPQDGSPVLAERGTRLGAALLDGLLIFAAFALLAWLSPWNVWRGDGGLAHTAMATALAFGVFLLINGHGLVTRGQTWGKRWLGIRIVGADGAPVPAWRLLGVRYGVGSLFGLNPVTQWIWSLADSLAIFHASRRCLHDRLARTIVVKA
jgi:uncharacterized RDD family membrane protein YckC